MVKLERLVQAAWEGAEVEVGSSCLVLTKAFEL